MYFRFQPRMHPRAYLHIALILFILVLYIPRGCVQIQKSAPEPTGQPISPGEQTYISVKMYDNQARKLVEMSMEDYVTGVVAAEMPASYELEALKAQAVAARTLAVKGMMAGGCSRYKGADVCDDSAHCQAYIPQEERKTNWGKNYDKYESKIEEAVKETAGLILTYNGQPITVLYHSTSGGKTEDVENVFAQSLPYLRSVDSPGEEQSSKFSTQQTFTKKEAADKLNARFAKANVSADRLSSQLVILNRYESGRVEKMRVGDVEVSGVEVRRALGLNSANFEFSFSKDKVTFKVIGYGHGVGMSQVGANAMAADGGGYDEILSHYYTGVELVDARNFVK